MVSEDEKDDLGINFDDDGEFYMSYEVFVENFDALEICHLGPGSLEEEDELATKMRWHEKHFFGAWIKGRKFKGDSFVNFIFIHRKPPFQVSLLEAASTTGIPSPRIRSSKLFLKTRMRMRTTSAHAFSL